MNRAFSLVELSIVLVILGLLTGGILAGQSLIRASELRAITTEYSRYVTAVQSFRDKYLTLPGDMPNAQSFWGIAHATAATCVTTVGTGTQTCNGDGDGMLDDSTGSNERFRFWQHLANAGLIEGNYSGVRAFTATTSASSTNSPSGRLSNSLWFADYFGPMTASVFVFDGNYGNIFQIGTPTAGPTGGSPSPALINPQEAWTIDTKIDDGKPAQGNVVVRVATSSFNVCTDASASTTLSASYLLTSSSASCALVFRNIF